MFSIKNSFAVLVLLFSFSLANAQLKIGDQLPDLQLQNDKNSTVKLNSSTGKVVLVDFWASWCGPCRLANKNLVKIYDNYKSEKFEIVGISIDTDQAKWLKAIEKDKLKNTQLIDDNGFDSQSAVLFGVDALPAAYLFDASGTLIAVNPTEVEIIAQIKKNN
ncbi:TlpA disulfide reductase family protein [Flavobacterium sp. TAB 87]|uniref:TlpA family protein disulfide reductase n=1 Tax=Flavobacterium sp. TAB 87 TaxID=1729581 RepID=UPI00076D70DB|nr:TlpA disulfide reductase family protein [Flavobacterium sp. TAB 87]KVV15686.1 Cytochrome c biogenesis protein TlpA [Flavobacterium sp. TAB 87]